MRVEIDQSGKIEDTNRLTIVAYSNGKSKSLMITAKDKKSIQSIFRKIKQPRVFVSKVFAAAIFCLIRDQYQKIDTLIIDNEYPGHGEAIKRYLREYICKNSLNPDSVGIHIQSIGKKSKAHDAAWRAFRAKKADIKASAQELIEIIFQ